jgi:geranylgeranyl diphosphate synthase type II
MMIPEIDPAAVIDPPGDFAARLAGYRALVQPVLLSAVPEREPRRPLYDIIRAYLARSGKALRPALCLAASGAFGGDSERVLPSAAALELVHNAFLVHDDIEDESEYRRDLPTMHMQQGIALAVNTGDAMTALGMRLLRRNLSLIGPELSWRVLDEFDHMMIETLEGQAMELGWIRQNECGTSQEDYLLMALKKTCWYSFIQPCRIGALVATGGDADLDRFNQFGYFLGIAFQIQDDILNLVGDRRRYGKEIGGDIWEGKRTLMLAHLLGACTADERERLRGFLGKPRKQRLAREVAWVYELLNRYRAIEHARQVARTFADGARQQLAVAFEGSVAGADLAFLRQLVEYVSSRDA